MILISHRGNLNGPSPTTENDPNYIDHAISICGNVEVDLRYEEGGLWLGHDKPQYKIYPQWVLDRQEYLWIHCKNIQVLEFITTIYPDWHYFWHQSDTVALTSYGYIWAYPGHQPIKDSIAVMPERQDDDTSRAIGICTDFVTRYL